MTIANQLTTISSTKQAIKQALIDKGVDMSGVVFGDYGSKVASLSTGGAVSGLEWSQELYDAAFADSLAHFDLALGALIPNITDEELVTGKAYALIEVTDSSSEFAKLVATFTGTCTINWGDGSTSSPTSGVAIEHLYSYSNANLYTVNGKKYARITVSCTGILTGLTFNETTTALQKTAYIAISAAGNALASIVMSSSVANTYLQKLEYFSSRKNAVTNMSYMFNNCYSLTTIPLLDTSAVTNMSSMFNNCYSLTTIPLLDTSAVTNMFSMFNNCYSLTTIPLLDTSAVTNMSSMFSYCYSLITIPLLDTNAVTDMSYMFSNCCSLTTVPLLDTNAVTDMSYMFSNSRAITTIPLLDTSAVTNMSYMFNNCYSLTTIPLLDTSAVTNMFSMFNNCYSLTTIPLLDTSAVTNMSSMFSYCSSLTSIGVIFRKTTSVQVCKLSATELNAIYTNLPTVSGQTLTVTGNWGTASDNPSIATAKGWTITG